jgi:uncharacterized protein (TIGR03435 family)
MTSRFLAFVGIVAVVGGLASALAAQVPANRAFEVASVKPTKTQGITLNMIYPGGRFTATNAPLGWLIKRAYGLQNDQLEGGASWMQSEHFDIDAKAAGNASSPEVMLMLRTLLTERFKLTLRHEARELPIYVLVTAKTDGTPGPHLTPSPDGNCVSPLRSGSDDDKRPVCGLLTPTGHWVGRRTTIDSLASSLSRVVSRVVVNRTGLTGNFDLDLQWTDLAVLLSPNGSSTDPPPLADGPSFPTALQEQLGLKLESTKGPVDVLVIDHVEHPTAD